MIGDLDPQEFKRDVESIRLLHIHNYQLRAYAWQRYNKVRAQEAAFHHRLATTTDPYERCALLGQNLSPRGNPALVLEEKWWKWQGYG